MGEVANTAVPLLTFARELARARTLNEVVVAVQAEMASATGYTNVWLALREEDDAEVVRILDFAGASRDEVLAQVPTVPIAGDAMMEELMRSNQAVVVEDGRTDPRTNKAIVEALGNRTIVNVPLAILDKPFGALGFGTFGDEGVRAPSPQDLHHTAAMAGLVSVAASRIRLEDKARESMERQRTVEARLARLQRLDTVGTLAGGVAHDFNNLLTVVLACANLARRAETREKLSLELDLIESTASRAQLLTRQLLAMSRSQPLTLVHVDPSALVGDLMAMLRRLIPSTIAIEVDSPPLGVTIEGDRTQLEQVITNLCINARDAMADGGRMSLQTKLVTINETFHEAHPWARPGRYVVISVSDTGHGISPSDLERIFDPFFTTKGEGRGTGLGLSISHGIVTQHGGMLHCYSEVGIGTTFKIYLPVADVAAARQSLPPIPTPAGGRERVLVGEDNEAVRAVVERVLERAGYTLTIARDGDAVVAMAADGTYDALLLDVVMPGLRCREVIERVRKLQPSMRIVLASGYTGDHRIAELIRDGSVTFLSKPYDPDSLLRALRAAMDA